MSRNQTIRQRKNGCLRKDRDMSVAYCCGLLYMAKWFSTAEGEGREGSRSVCLTLLPLSHMWMGWRVIRGTSTSSIPNSLRDLGEGRGLRNKGPESPSYPAFTLLLLLVFTLLVDGLTKIHKSCMPHRLDVLGGGGCTAVRAESLVVHWMGVGT